MLIASLEKEETTYFNMERDGKTESGISFMWFGDDALVCCNYALVSDTNVNENTSRLRLFLLW